MKKSILLTTLTILLVPVLAHEFWLHPARFFYRPGEKLNIQFLVGENYEGENWKGNKDRVQQLYLYTANGRRDLASQLSGKEGDSLSVTLEREGTAMVIFQSKNSYIELESAKFLEYLKEDGLQNAIDYRTKNKETDSIGREFYQRSVKTLVRCGSKTDGVPSTPTTLPLDILALQNPYALKDRDTLTLRILFQQKPLKNQVIKVWRRLNGETVKAEILSNEAGEIRIPHYNTGRWMISTVKMERLPANNKAQWQSYWGSLTYGAE